MSIDAKEIMVEIQVGDKIKTMNLITLLSLLIEEVKDSPTFMPNFNVALIRESLKESNV